MDSTVRGEVEIVVRKLFVAVGDEDKVLAEKVRQARHLRSQQPNSQITNN